MKHAKSLITAKESVSVLLSVPEILKRPERVKSVAKIIGRIATRVGSVLGSAGLSM